MENGFLFVLKAVTMATDLELSWKQKGWEDCNPIFPAFF
jgi:hypothetical protein